MQNNKKETALYYQSLNLSIIPTGKDKKPLISWKQYQEKCATVSEINSWWAEWPEANPALVTGKISGIIALDLDAKHGRTSKQFTIPPTASAKSGNNGEHFFFKYPGFHVETKSAISGEGVDIRGDGGYILLAPSVNSNDGLYEWIIPIQDSLADAPEWLLKTFKTSEKKWAMPSDKVVEGNRNDTATSVAGIILATLPKELQESTGWPGLIAWNKSITKPLSEKELRSVWESVKKYGGGKNKTPTQSDSLLIILDEHPDIVLFHDERGTPFMSVDINGHREIWSCKSKNMRDWLSHEYWKKYNKGPNSEALKNAMSVIEGKARFSGEKHRLNNRSAWNDEELWYDLTNEKWQAIKISKGGWSVVDKPPILFKRYAHHMAQVLPGVGGDASLILNYVNITNDQHRLLIMVFMICCFIPDFPHAVLLIHGSHGSAKTTLARLKRLIIDPSFLDTVSLPYNYKELIQVLDHHAFIFFDNVSAISTETSDILCKAVTGSGFSKRELYTDDDDVIYNFKRCIGINGINIVATRPDLLERSLLIELERIEPSQRKEEGELMESFKKDLPLILGGIFDTLAKALEIKPTVKLASSPRMADFAAWGCAIAQALGYSQEDFLNAYKENIHQQNEVVINENIVALAIIAFMEDKTEWSGTATELLRTIDGLGFLEDMDKYEKYWPKSSGAFSRKINELKVNLNQEGISCVHSSNGLVRKITLRKLKKKEDKIPTTQPLPFMVENGIKDDMTT